MDDNIRNIFLCGAHMYVSEVGQLVRTLRILGVPIYEYDMNEHPSNRFLDSLRTKADNDDLFLIINSNINFSKMLFNICNDNSSCKQSHSESHIKVVPVVRESGMSDKELKELKKYYMAGMLSASALFTEYSYVELFKQMGYEQTLMLQELMEIIGLKYWGDKEEAYESLSAQYADDFRYNLSYGTEAMIYKRFEIAESKLKHSLSLSNESSIAHDRYAVLLAKFDRYQEAEEHFVKALELCNKNAKVHHNYANVLTKLDRRIEAEAHYKKSLGLSPGNFEQRNNLSNIYLVQNRFMDFLNLNETIESSREFTGRNLGIVLNDLYSIYLSNTALFRYLFIVEEKDYIRNLSNLLDVYGVIAEANNNYGVYLTFQGEVKQAESHFAVSLANNPGNAYTLNNYANLLTRTGQIVEAGKKYEQALLSNSGSPHMLNNYAIHLFESRDFKGAEKYFREALVEGTGLDVVHKNLAVTLYYSGQLELAISHLKTALALNPDTFSTSDLFEIKYPLIEKIYDIS